MSLSECRSTLSRRPPTTPSPPVPQWKTVEKYDSWRSTWYQSNFRPDVFFIILYMYIYIFHSVAAVKLAMCNIFSFFLLPFSPPSPILVEFHRNRARRNIFRLIFPRRGGEKRERERKREEKGFFPLICRNCSLRYAAGKRVAILN